MFMLGSMNEGCDSESVLTRLDDDDRDLPGRAPLVAGVTAVGGDDPRPQFGTLGPRRRAGPHRLRRPVDRQLDLGVGDEVAVPLRIALVAALGGDEDHAAGLTDRRGEHHRPPLAGLAPGRVQLDRGHPGEAAAQPTSGHGEHRLVELVHPLEEGVGQLLSRTHRICRLRVCRGCMNCPMATLLERDAELARLAGALDDAAGGHGRVAFVAGDAGVGKSSLVAELVARARTTAAIGRCDPLVTPRALGPFLDVAAALGLAAPADRDGLLGCLVDAIGHAGPTVVVVEDAHWADDATLELLAMLGRRAVDLPLALVVTYRDGDVRRRPHAAPGDRRSGHGERDHVDRAGSAR